MSSLSSSCTGECGLWYRRCADRVIPGHGRPGKVLDGVPGVAVSPDGKHVYAAGFRDDAAAVFSRDEATGALTFVEVHKDGFGSVDGLDGASDVTISPYGAHIYVASGFDDAVVVLSRDGATRELTFVELQRDGVGVVDGLDGAISLTVSLDGGHLYAAGPNDNAVAAFSRDSNTGALTFVEVQRDGVGDVDGLSGAVSVTVSSDGEHLYAAGQFDNAVAVFSRNEATGALTFVEVQRDGVGSVDGLDAARSVAVSADGKHLYAAGQTDDAIAVFSVAAAPATPVPSVSQWGLIAMAGTLAALLLWRRRRGVDRAKWGLG